MRVVDPSNMLGFVQELRMVTRGQLCFVTVYILACSTGATHDQMYTVIKRKLSPIDHSRFLYKSEHITGIHKTHKGFRRQLKVA